MNLKNIEISYIIPLFQNNKENKSLNKRLRQYESYNNELLNKIHFIFVDDCSPIPIKINSDKLNYSIYRMTDDITWNQGGARNLGVNVARSSKLILTDLDIVFPESLLSKLISLPIPKEIFIFKRFHNGINIKPHPNTFFCSKSTFFKTLGIDEEFCGHYGYEDIYFIALQEHLKTKIKLFKKDSISVDIDKIDQHSLTRDSSKNKLLLDYKLEALKTKTPFSNHSRKFLNFNWEIIESNFTKDHYEKK